MIKKYILSFVLFLFSGVIFAQAQDSVLSRVIFIGDAGVESYFQTELIHSATQKILPNRTVVVYLGNNIYPDGMNNDTNKQADDIDILKKLYEPMRQNGAAVYLIPGNRDWDNRGKDGLEKIKAQWQYIQNQADSLLKVIPGNGCPGPVAVHLADGLVMIVLDTEWWLYPSDMTAPEDDCGGMTQRDVIGELRQMLYENRNKSVLFVTHHPFESYGSHAGYFTWKQHLFPLTDVNRNLYLPLPGVGSLYPLFRKTFPGSEDLRHPSYKSMIRNISNVTDAYPNLFQISAHDNGLQLIRNPYEGHNQIVTGIGGKKDILTKNGKYSFFNESVPGYVVADWLPDQSVHFQFFGYKDGSVSEVYDYDMLKQPMNDWDEIARAPYLTDSIVTATHPAYSKMGKFGRFWFGNNYRDAWAAKVKLPVLDLSKLYGGLKPVKLGGGFQSTSLRLENPDGVQYVLRSVEKNPDLVVPAQLQTPLVREIINDAFSAQHPYSALMVPPIAEAAGVPHAHPIIGVVAPDTMLGQYEHLFVGRVNLLEEREPLPNTDNFIKAEAKLTDNYKNDYDGINFLKARMIDVLVADWDRHGDQWRFHKEKKPDGGWHYTVVPRDRDQVVYVTQGVFPYIGRRFFLMPRVTGFKANLMRGSNYYLFKSAFLLSYPSSFMTHQTWTNTVDDFTKAMTDSVLQASVATLPKGLNKSENDRIYEDLKARRDQLPQAMEKYYKLSNRIVDIQASNKAELASIEGLPNQNGLKVSLLTLTKKGLPGDTLMSKIFPKSYTKEIRLYMNGGDDSIYVDNKTSNIKVRIIGGDGQKVYNVAAAKRKIKVYDQKPETYLGEGNRLHKRISSDTSNTSFIPVDMYDTWLPLATASINPDDGISLGLGIRFVQQRGFKKFPYTAVHNLMVSHSFSTNAFAIDYSGDWNKVVGKADFVLEAQAEAPNNTQNFYGVGNETVYQKGAGSSRFYRSRFSLYTLHPYLRWSFGRYQTFSVGPSLQYYTYSPKENEGRFINEGVGLNSSDTATLIHSKLHLGADFTYEFDMRNDKVLPTYGIYAKVQALGYGGLTQYATSYGQLNPEVALYKNLDEKQSIVLADRIGGSITVGKPAFYQYAYLGGQGNLLGFRKYRFAGMQSFYNNFEVRVAFSNFGNFLMKGQMGLSGFYDVGRVWAKHEHSDVWHHGVGGGLYFAPAGLAVFRFNIGYSKEGWYPEFKFGFRF